MRELELTKGYKALVDDEDYYWVSQFNWQAIELDGQVYGRRNKKKGLLKGGEPYETYLHRVVMKCTDKSKVVDHRDHNGLNCQKDNLRICLPEENKRNVRSYKGSSSKYLGVSWNKHRKIWQVQVTNRNKKIVRAYEDEIIAARAYDKFSSELHGEFANLNFADSPSQDILDKINIQVKRPFIMTEFHKKACKEGLAKVDWKELRRDKMKRVINTNTGEIFESLIQAANHLAIPKSRLSKYLIGSRTNKTTLKYL